MREYIDEAIVLDKDENGNMDSRIMFFTKRFGKLIAKAKSARKITSKLAGHLQPGNLVRVRLIEKNGLQTADSLKITELDRIRLSDLYLLNKLLAEAEEEPRLWNLLVSSNAFNWPAALKILGWDSDETDCAICHKSPEVFSIKNQEFFCRKCALNIKDKELILIENTDGHA